MNLEQDLDAAGVNWEGDMQFQSMALERKVEAEANFGKYLAEHPDVKGICSDFLKHLLIFKPVDVVAEAVRYFGSFEAAIEISSEDDASNTKKVNGTDSNLGEALVSIGPSFRGTAAVAVYHVYGEPQ
eukprot:m.170061 g.170061  ORF g.170061 m.170061 type:complete len:128 (-) comp18255_c0_seq1:150-533(-)